LDSRVGGDYCDWPIDMSLKLPPNTDSLVNRPKKRGNIAKRSDVVWSFSLVFNEKDKHS
jgi:hypothetical protein